MNNIIFIIKSAFEDFRRNKIRTFLTSLGILIGVASVVLLNAFGLGLKQYIKDQFENLGTNLIIVFPGQILQGGGFRAGGGALGGAEFDEKDIITLKKVDNVSYVVPVFMKSVTLKSDKESKIGDLFASTSDIFAIRNLEAEYGELFTKTDLDKRAKVVVIGPTIAEDLYGDVESAAGRSVKIENQRYKIIGVLKSKGGGGGLGGPDFDSFVYMPYKTAYTFNPKKTFISIYLKAENDQAIPQIKEDINTLLLRRYEEDDFSVIEQTEILEAVNSIFSILNTILIFIGAISLIVGGIGIMNIMYVSVVERTKEIGIRRAIGATKNDILTQFLTESITLSLIGGLSGVLLAVIITFFVQRMFPAYVSIQSVLIAFFVSSAIGIGFGVFPARKAANLTPVEAIRYE